MVLARSAAAVVLLVLASTGTTAADEATLRLLKIWIAAVHAHVPGSSDEAAASIAGWARSDLIQLRPFVHALVGSVPDPRRVGVPRIRLSNADAAEVRVLAKTALGSRSANDFIKRAALLHSDLVLRASSIRTVLGARPLQPQLWWRANSGASLETPRVIARAPDGRFEGMELGNLNWDYARDLLDGVTPRPASDETVRLWYRAVGAWFASGYSFGEAFTHFQRANKLLPDNPGVLFGDGAIQETFASPGIQDYVRVTQLPGQQKFLWVTSARDHLEKAERLFVRTLRFEPGFVEAKLRLARVIDQQGRHDEALAKLTAVLEARPDRVLTFYTHLFRGDAERALLRYDAARQSYQQALELFPLAQSARIALSHLARQRSDQEAALSVLLPTLSASPVGRKEDDPWWDYHRGDGRHAEELLQQLRAPFQADRLP